MSYQISRKLEGIGGKAFNFKEAGISVDITKTTKWSGGNFRQTLQTGLHKNIYCQWDFCFQMITYVGYNV